MEDKTTKTKKNKAIGDFVLAINNENKIENKEGRSLVVRDEDKSEIVIVDGKKYELKPFEKLATQPTFFMKLASGEEKADESLVYRVSPDTGLLLCKQSFPLPENYEKLSGREQQLVVLNSIYSLVPITEKKLETNTMPKPLLNILKMRLLLGFGGLGFAALAYMLQFASWHVFPFFAIYSFVQFWNAANTYYYIRTRNFKMFSGIITNIFTKNGWSPSLRKVFIQISNGKKFITFPYNFKGKKTIKTGSPATIFIPNNAEITETEFGPTVDLLLAVSFSLDVKSADKAGEYQDGRMKDKNVIDFFEED